jgi:hypothetical protein
MEWWHVYLFTRLDGLNTLIGLLVAISVLSWIIIGIVWFINTGIDNDVAARAKKLFINSAAVPVVLAVLMVFVPSQKEAAAIYLLPKLAHSDFAKEAQQLPTDAAKLMRLKLESWIADMEPAKKAEKK